MKTGKPQPQLRGSDFLGSAIEFGFILCTISDYLLFPPNKSNYSRQAARAERLASRRPTQPPAPEPAEMDVDDERPNQNQAPATTVQTQPAGLPQSDNARTQQERVGTINIICY